MRSYFNTTGMEKFRLVKATLWVYLESPGNSDLIVQRYVLPLFIHKFINGREINDDPAIKKELKLGLYPNGAWVDLDITAIVKDWIANPNANYGIMVKAMYHGQDLVNRKEDPVDKSRV